jgi:hypothetical protein
MLIMLAKLADPRYQMRIQQRIMTQKYRSKCRLYVCIDVCICFEYYALICFFCKLAVMC